MASRHHHRQHGVAKPTCRYWCEKAAKQQSRFAWRVLSRLLFLSRSPLVQGQSHGARQQQPSYYVRNLTRVVISAWVFSRSSQRISTRTHKLYAIESCGRAERCWVERNYCKLYATPNTNSMSPKYGCSRNKLQTKTIPSTATTECGRLSVQNRLPEV